MEVSAIIWMFVVLKIPIFAALYLIWYAIQEPEPVADDADDAGGGSDRDDGPRPRRPRPPRRGPHGTPAPAPPARVRTGTAAKPRHAPR